MGLVSRYPGSYTSKAQFPGRKVPTELIIRPAVSLSSFWTEMLLFALFNEVTTYFTGDSIILVFKTLLKYSSACFVT